MMATTTIQQQATKTPTIINKIYPDYNNTITRDNKSRDDKSNINNDDDDDESHSSSSINTNDALLELLGIENDNSSSNNNNDIFNEISFTTIINDDDDDDDTLNDIKNHSSQPQPTLSPTSPSLIPITIPPRCSRYLHPPSHCYAILIPSLLSPSECQSLITKASSPSSLSSSSSSKKSSGGFRYITHASHVTNEGEHLTVALQNPSMHKLSVYHDNDVLEMLWGRLQPIFLQINDDDERPRWWDERRRRRRNDFQKGGLQRPIGLNPRIRVLRYDADDDDRFEPHFDATTRYNDKCTKAVGDSRSGAGAIRSRLTVLAYLNNGDGCDFDGGETVFLNATDTMMTTTVDRSLFGRRRKLVNEEGVDEHETKKEEDDDDDDVTRVTPQAGSVVIFDHDLYHGGAPLTWGTKYVMRTDVMFDDEDDDDDEYCNDTTVVSPSLLPVADGDHDDDDVKRRINHRRHQDDETGVQAEDDHRKNDDVTAMTSISDMATVAGLSMVEREYLDDIGVWHVTPEAFLAPGVMAMRLMLVDGGFNDERMERLIMLAMEAVKLKK